MGDFPKSSHVFYLCCTLKNSRVNSLSIANDMVPNSSATKMTSFLLLPIIVKLVNALSVSAVISSTSSICKGVRMCMFASVHVCMSACVCACVCVMKNVMFLVLFCNNLMKSSTDGWHSY